MIVCLEPYLPLSPRPPGNTPCPLSFTCKISRQFGICAPPVCIGSWPHRRLSAEKSCRGWWSGGRSGLYKDNRALNGPVREDEVRVGRGSTGMRYTASCWWTWSLLRNGEGSTPHKTLGLFAAVCIEPEIVGGEELSRLVVRR